MFGQVFGTPLVTAVAPLLAQDNLVGSPISWDAEWVNKPNLFPNGSTYQGQILNGIDYYINNLGGAGKTVCSLSTTSAYGKAGFEGFNFAKGKLNFKFGTSIEVGAADTNMTSAMSTFKSAGCDAISITTAGAQTTSALVSGSQSGYTPIFLGAAPSFGVEQLTAATSELYGKYYYVAGDTPQWNDPTTPGFKQMIEDARKTEPFYVDNVNTGFMAGYVEAITDAALLEKAVQLGDLGKDGIKTAMAQVGKVPLGGLFPEYDYVAPEKRVAPGYANIFRADASYPGGIVLVKMAHQSSVVFKR